MCPHCGSPMLVLEWNGVEADYCPECGGVWLDAGELELLAELSGEPASRVRALMDASLDRGAGRRRCPRCRRRLRVVEVTVDGGEAVQVDRCRRGEGVWLDAGELERLLRRDAPILARHLKDVFPGGTEANRTEQGRNEP